MTEYINLNNLSALYRVGCDRIYDLYQNFSKYYIKTTPRLFPKVSFLSAYGAFFSEPTHIVDNIYLGSAFNATNQIQLKKLNIDLILNITPDISNHYPTNFTYVQCPVQDNGLDKISPHFETTYDTIISHNNEFTQNILVHCFMGASRSVSIIVYYLMKNKSYTLDEAIKVVQSKRPIINLSKSFYAELEEAHKKILSEQTL